MRPLDLVIDAIIKLIPESYPTKRAIKDDLEKVKNSIPFTAPEVMYERWGQVAEILSYSVGTPDTEWKKMIGMLFADKVDYRHVLSN